MPGEMVVAHVNHQSLGQQNTGPFRLTEEPGNIEEALLGWAY